MRSSRGPWATWKDLPSLTWKSLTGIRHYQCSGLLTSTDYNASSSEVSSDSICRCPSGFGGNLCDMVASSAPLNCGRSIEATSTLMRLRVRMTVGPVRRQCVYHIRVVD
ncbi:hypothetical protein COOONC_26906 [Cooperia oncophora]